jgi:hypothetical protein
MRIYLPFSKRDKNAEGQEWTIKEMQKLCPVNVMLDCKVARLAQEGRTSVCESGPLGRVSSDHLHINSVMKLMRSTLHQGG